jgi:hypothetical protein
MLHHAYGISWRGMCFRFSLTPPGLGRQALADRKQHGGGIIVGYFAFKRVIPQGVKRNRCS